MSTGSPPSMSTGSPPRRNTTSGHRVESLSLGRRLGGVTEWRLLGLALILALPAAALAAGAGCGFGTAGDGDAANAPTDPENGDAYREAVVRLMRDFHVPGVVAGVSVPGRKSWKQALGFGDVEGPRPLRLDDHFPIRSLTQSFTATLILQLVRNEAALPESTRRRPVLKNRVPEQTEEGLIDSRHALTLGTSRLRSTPRVSLDGSSANRVVLTPCLEAIDRTDARHRGAKELRRVPSATGRARSRSQGPAITFGVKACGPLRPCAAPRRTSS
jgi:hypothetical protein